MGHDIARPVHVVWNQTVLASDLICCFNEINVMQQQSNLSDCITAARAELCLVCVNILWFLFYPASVYNIPHIWPTPRTALFSLPAETQLEL